MVTKIGMLVDNAGVNQLSYMFIKSCNEYLATKDSIDPILYYRNLQPFIIQPRFACAIMYEAYRGNENLITTDLNGAARCLEWFIKNRYFYAFDLEWHFSPQKSFEQFNQIYTNPKLKIIARSDEHAKILELSWGCKVWGINPNCSIETFRDIIQGKGE